MYPVANGIYYIQSRGKDVTMRELRITEEEYNKLAKCTEDKTYFAYMLFDLGIVDRWKKEADEFIAFLEEKCGYKWENPYKPEEERFRLVLTDEQRKDVEDKIAEGYYTDEAIEARAKKAHEEARYKMYDKVNREYEDATEEARIKRDVYLCILNAGLKIDNVIYYNSSNKLVFNWMTYRDKVSREEFDRFVAEADYSLLPDGIEIKFGEEK